MQNVIAYNDTGDDTIAVEISWDPPACPNGLILYYRIIFLQTMELFFGGSGFDDDNGCPPINTTMIEKRISYNGATEPPTTIILDDLGQFVLLTIYVLYINNYVSYGAIFDRGN